MQEDPRFGAAQRKLFEKISRLARDDDEDEQDEPPVDVEENAEEVEGSNDEEEDAETLGKHSIQVQESPEVDKEEKENKLDEVESEEDNEDEQKVADEKDRENQLEIEKENENKELEENENKAQEIAKEKKKKNVVKGMSKAELKNFQKENDRRGVIYISRIPPFMQPVKLRHLLSQYGEICRIYLTPDEKSKRKKTAKKARKFVDGWVEFADKKTAKRVAKALNCQQIGGKRRSRYYDETWNMKYLKGFKWASLSEKIVHDRITREQRIRREMVQANKESNLYIKRANQNKGHMAMEERKKKTKTNTGIPRK